MQYYKPDDPNLWVGDCMPFYHAGLFHFYYLLDEGHHQALGGLGGHQWAHATSPDLVTWTHHPLALAITEEEERSICTGSIFYHEGTYYAFHAVRRPDWSQRLGIATSPDAIHFTKQPVPPHADPPPAYDPHHFRDPNVFYDAEGQRFHMLVTAKNLEYSIPALGGCLAHLVSADLQQWQLVEPFVIPGFTDVPECPDHFEWNGWYYLVFSNRLQARYRMARSPLGPWLRPACDVLDGPWGRVMKTAAFHDNRRLGVAWIGTRHENSVHGRFQWGGHAIFRELVQQPDGTLGTKFPAEMIPATGAPLPLPVAMQTAGVTVEGDTIRLEAGEGTAAAALANLPRNFYLRLTVRPLPNAGGLGSPRFGVRVREQNSFVDGVALEIHGAAQRVELGDAAVEAVAGLEGVITLEIVTKDDLIDVCVNGRICLINCCPQQIGAGLTFFCQTGSVVLEEIAISPLMED